MNVIEHAEHEDNSYTVEEYFCQFMMLFVIHW